MFLRVPTHRIYVCYLLFRIYRIYACYLLFRIYRIYACYLLFRIYRIYTCYLLFRIYRIYACYLLFRISRISIINKVFSRLTCFCFYCLFYYNQKHPLANHYYYNTLFIVSAADDFCIYVIVRSFYQYVFL